MATCFLFQLQNSGITLVGRGGIGKTSLTLSVLHGLTKEEKFIAILWFSARDIDLLPEGPKRVRPHVLTEKDIAAEFVRLMSPAEEKGFNVIAYLSRQLTRSEQGGPLLFVFDNFETVRNPVELFKWLDTYVRLPNKVLLTTRFREFKGDYPVEVPGMAENEFEELVDIVSDKLGVRSQLTEAARRELYRESDGHPYVAKLLLGEMARAGKASKIERVIARSDEVLDALFERTFSRLSPAARRVFLTLCNWRSLVPQLATEAVLLRPANEKMDVLEAIEELRQSSFIDVLASKEDDQVFLAVPLVASVFGNKKLAVSPMKAAVEADTVLLQAFGASQQQDLRHGIAPHVERIFRNVAFRVSQGKEKLEDFTPMLEFIARKYPVAWLSLSKLYEESNLDERLERAKHAALSYLESGPKGKDLGWKRIADLCQRANDYSGEVHALVEMSLLAGTPFDVVSNAADRLNSIFYHNYMALDSDERQILVRKLVDVMERRIEEADADGCSRIAWLCLHLHDNSKARSYAERGLRIDSRNDYCQKLATRLGISVKSGDEDLS